MNSAGMIRPRSVLPAHERLGGRGVAGGQRDDRLVVHGELAHIDRAPHVVLHLAAVQHHGLRLGVEALEARLAGHLGLVHGHVGVADQLILVGGALAGGRDADAQPYREQLAAGLDRKLEGLHDPLGDGLGGALGVEGVVQAHGELVAAEPGDLVLRTHTRAQPVSHAHQQLVADGVAERVVDGLEVVDVDEQDR